MIFIFPKKSVKKWQKWAYFDIEVPKISQIYIEKWAIYKKDCPNFKYNIINSKYFYFNNSLTVLILEILYTL